MKNLFLTVISVIALSTTTVSQVVNQIIISPPNPSANDTISVISNLSYYGNCSFGLVHSYTYLAGSIVQITPTYCGYFDTTLCNVVDTFKIGPFPAGNYTINIEYHQGSVCPVSGFDAIIAQIDTLLIVSGTSEISDLNSNSHINVYPNPSNGIFMLTNENASDIKIEIFDMMGKSVYAFNNFRGMKEIDISELPNGIYIMNLVSDYFLLSTKKIFIMK